MNICAIICEYNPIHFGHIYHMEESRKITGCDKILSLMSGNFVQRGEPAIADKHTRAKTALLCGSDIVIELPCAFALGNAELFAEGAIRMLNIFGVSHLSFGSECGDIKKLNSAAALLSEESPELSRGINELLNTGLTYPKCLETAFDNLYPELKGMLSSPNNILAIEYLKAIKKTNSCIIPVAIKRKGLGYNDTIINSEYPSSTAIRKLLSDKNSSAANYAPTEITELIRTAVISAERMYGGLSALTASTLKNINKTELDALYDATQDLTSRIKSAAAENSDYNALLNAAKAKHITMARIKRLSLYSLLGITKKLISEFLDFPNYFNILAVKKDTRDLLKNPNINTIACFTDYEKISDKNIKQAAELDSRAAEIYSYITGKNCAHFAHRIFIK